MWFGFLHKVLTTKIMFSEESMLTNKFEEIIQKYNMLSHGDSIVAGISGGSDSVCLLHLLCSLKDKYALNINAVHINHGIRETAKRDEDFVRNLCEKWNISFFSAHFDVPEIAKEQKISEELCGRNVRYAFFEEVAEKTCSHKIFTAHNKNDNAETFLLNLLRGSGSGGLSVMQPKRENLLRPLLFFTKAEIEEYLIQNNITWVEDETNELNLYTRNLLRHEVIPMLCKINPSAENTILRSAALLKEDNDFIMDLAENSGAYKDGSIDLKIFASLPIPVAKRVILKALKDKNLEISENIIQNILNLSEKQSGKTFVFPCGSKAVREYNFITFIKENEKCLFSYDIKKNETLYIKELNKYVSLTEEKPEKPYLAISDRCSRLTVRNLEEGDSFLPSGMNGHKKLSDFFSDKKIPLSRRNKIPIFLFEGTIIAVGDIRVSKDFTPRDKNTLYLKISEV